MNAIGELRKFWPNSAVRPGAQAYSRWLIDDGADHAMSPAVTADAQIARRGLSLTGFCRSVVVECPPSTWKTDNVVGPPGLEPGT